ncbi:MAG: hypothetical protein J0H88_12940 [Sphingomonadales bacterium]|nr:hypothetical protein [Sphingomonadales bacterium]
MFDFTRRSLLAAGAVTLIALAGCSGGGKEETKASVDTTAETEATAAPAFALVTLPVGKKAPADLVAQLAAAKSSGDVSDVLLLKSKPSAEGPLGFDQLAVLEFPSEAAFNKWNGTAVRKLGTDLVIRRADLLVDRRAKEHPATAIYVLGHYDTMVDAAKYGSFTEGYISPNLDGQIKAGGLTGYAMYYEREPVEGIKGNRAILVKQYTDEAGWHSAEKAKVAIREELKKDPAWMVLDGEKPKMREQISGTLATPIAVK